MRGKMLLTVLLMFAVLLGLTACSGALESISIRSLPDKLEYEVGESIDLTGGEIDAVYENGNERTVKMNHRLVTVEGFDSSRPGSVTLTVTYLKKSTTFNVTVIGETEEPEVTSITIGSAPTKTTYFVGDSAIDFTGGTIKLNYSNGTSKNISMTATGVTTDTYSLASAGVVTIYLNYMSFRTSFDVVVSEPVVNGIVIKTQPTQTEYSVGDPIDLSGGVITASYNNGTSVDVAMTHKDVTAAYDFATPGTKEVTVSYHGFTAKFSVLVNEVIPYEPDWDHIAFVIEEGLTNILYAYMYGDDLCYLWFWFSAEYEYNQIMSSGNTEWISIWEQNYQEGFLEMTAFFDEWFYAYAPDLFDTQSSLDLLRAASAIMYNAYYNEDYAPESAEFQEDCLKMINAFKKVPVALQCEFVAWIADGFTVYTEMSATYYEQILGYDMTVVYYDLIRAIIFYNFADYEDDDSFIESFLELMTRCVANYEALEDKATFDEYFPEYAEYKAIYDELYIPTPGEYDWDYVKEVFNGLDENTEGTDDVLYLYYYFEMLEIIAELEEINDAEMLAFLNDTYGARITTAKEFYISWFLDYAPELLTQENGLNYIKLISYMGYALVSETINAEFDTLVAQHEALYNELSDMQKYQLIVFVNSYVFYCTNSIATYYYSVVGYPLGEINTWYFLIQADMIYSAWLASNDDEFLDLFIEYMGYAYNRYNVLPSTVLFDSLFGELYNDMLEIYLQYVTPLEGILGKIETWINVATDEWNNYNDTSYFYYYYMILRAIESIYDSGDQELIAEYESQLLDYFLYWESETYGWYATELTDLYYDAEFKQFVLYYSYTLIMYLSDESYYGSEEFNYNLKYIIDLYDSFDSYTKAILIFGELFVDLDPYENFLFLTADYYFQFMPLSAAQVYVYLREADMWYNYFTTGIVENTNFLLVMEMAMSAYSGLSSADRAAFDLYLLDMYEDYVDIYNSINPNSIGNGFHNLCYYWEFRNEFGF